MTDLHRSVAVSACLLGRPVRYDGRDKRLPMLDGLFPESVEYVPFCPEVAIGLGVPRQPIRLWRNEGAVRLVDRLDSSIDHGPAMTAHVHAWLAAHPALAGMIVKERSPSCALGDAPVLSPDGDETLADGLFTSLVRRLRPELPVVDGAGLADEETRARFVLTVLGHPTQ